MKQNNAKKILIADDEHLVLEKAAEYFKKEGFEVVLANDGQQAFSEALNKKPDIIILDILMPKMDGLEVLKKLRKDKWGKQAKVIVLTNLNQAQKSAEAMDLGVMDYLVKNDWSVEQVVAKVNKILS